MAEVWIISVEQWPRAMLRAELIELGYDAVGFLSIDDALLRLYRRPGQKPKAIILDLNELDISQARLAALRRNAIPIAILGGSAELADPAVSEFPWEFVFRRPFMIRDVIEAVHNM